MNKGEHIGSPLQNEHPFAFGRHPSKRGEFLLTNFSLNYISIALGENTTDN
jgi:hypothetical protein